MIEYHGKNWDLEVTSALWSYQTSVKTSTGFLLGIWKSSIVANGGRDTSIEDAKKSGGRDTSIEDARKSDGLFKICLERKAITITRGSS